VVAPFSFDTGRFTQMCFASAAPFAY
jgi:hypothetical protein